MGLAARRDVLELELVSPWDEHGLAARSKHRRNNNHLSCISLRSVVSIMFEISSLNEKEACVISFLHAPARSYLLPTVSFLRSPGSREAQKMINIEHDTR